MLTTRLLRRATLFVFAAVSLSAGGAQRIVSTAPSITEALFAMGLGNRIVGDTVYCNYPPEATKIKRIGTLMRPDLEAVVALHPDLVILQKQPGNTADQLTRLHVPWLVVDSANLDDVYAGARAMAKAAGTPEAAEKLVTHMQSELQRIRALTAPLPKISALFLVAHTPGRLEGLIAGAGKSIFSDLLDIAGGTDVLSDTTIPYLKISLEEVIARNPDTILELSGETVQKQEELLALWKPHSTLKAVRNGRVYAVPNGPFMVPGPRSVDAAKELLRLLHPEIHP